MKLKMELPALKHEALVKEYIDACFKVGEFTINGGSSVEKYTSYEEWVNIVNKNRLGIDLPRGYVKATTYFLIGEKMLGTINIRHELNESLLNHGGHIGYSVHPDFRRLGYATYMLKFALKKCQELGINEVLVTCKKENIASKKTIEKCGGVLEDERLNQEDGHIYLRYWIQTGGLSND